MTPVSCGPDEPRGTGDIVAAGARGQTTIADRVVAKIAAQAAHEALGRLPPEAARPQATVVVRPQAPDRAGPAGMPVDAARVRVHLELDYPSDIGSRCARVRRHVVERVGALVGMEVPEVAVQVERLHLAAAHAAQGRTR
ncbi:Asp23/Gls24 family envelope stress response protein [Streptomyces sp. NPDC047706]|uniref:Asp23/Gls24 family envelope stress response protein n=1 Tax=Streptomyces sp. NPDC047706 TaxID=3365486 RepID=UPI003719DE70